MTRLRRAFRRLTRAPFFTAVAVATLAIGIGANVAIFSVINGVLLKPLPFAEPERLVGVWHTAPGLGVPLMNQSPATYLTYREEGRVWEDIGLWDTGAVSVTGIGEPERVQALYVTDGVLPLLRVQPLMGRRFTADDDSPRTPERVMLMHAYWQRKFGSDPAVVGRTVMIDNSPKEVIGILPAGFRFLSANPQVVLPFRIDRSKVFVGNFSYQGVARLKPGVTLEQANADMMRVLPHVLDKFPLPPGFTKQMFNEVHMGANVRPLEADAIGDVGRVLWVLLGTVSLVLLIACANVANLFLVRAEARQQELAIHAALGAGWRRIASELLSESVLLGLLGGAAGLGLAYAGIQLLVAIAPDGLPRVGEIGFDSRVLMFTIAVSLGAGLLFGLLPVLKFARPNLANALKQGGRLSSSGRERHRARNTLVVAEIALAVVLLVASGLMMRTFQALRHVQPGFTDPAQVLTMRIAIPGSLIKDEVQTARAYQQIQEKLLQVPGVTSVGLSSSITMDGNDANDPVFVEDFPSPEGRIPALRRYKWVGADYVKAMGNHVVAGRAITWNDVLTKAPVVMINETLAREFWKDPGAAVGRRVRNSPQNPWRTVIGVVGDERDNGAAKPAPAGIYFPMLVENYWTMPVMVQRSMGFAIRSDRAKSTTLVKEVQQAVWSVNPNLPVANVRTLDQIAAGSMSQTSFALVMLGIAATVALLLGIVGIYGVIAYVAAQRTREIGIRMALGAAGSDVSGLFLRHGVTLAAAGLGIGLAIAALATRVMASLLFGVSRLDPLTYIVVVIALGGTALLASYIPAVRAGRVDPAVALRTEI